MTTGNKYLLVFSVLIVGLLIYGGIYTVDALKTKQAETLKAEKAQQQLNEVSLKSQRASYYGDSLNRIVIRLSDYRHVSEMNAYRDSVSRILPLKPGDYAFKKVDSSKVLITDIIIGGGQYDYYYRYKILDNKGNEFEIKPELLYEK